MGMQIAGTQRRDVYELPPDEMRELIVNAFAHHNYFDHEAPIFVAIYDTRVEITSPGCLPRGLTVEKALAGCSKIRNRAIAAALTYMRYVEGWGSGLLRVSSGLVRHGLDPLEVTEDVVDVRVNVRRRTASEAEGPEDPATGGGTSDAPGRGNPTEVVNEVVNEVVRRDEAVRRIYTGIKQNPGIRKPYLLKIVKTSRATAERAIAQLRESGKIEFRGAPKTGGYFCK